MNATNQWAIELLASMRFEHYLSISKAGNIRLDKAKIKAAEKYDGKWVIETNDDTISLKMLPVDIRGLWLLNDAFDP